MNDSKLQLRREISIDAPVQSVWSVLENSTLLPQWASIVKSVTLSAGVEGGVGEVRTCSVEFGSSKGFVTERCVEAIPHRKISYAVDEDTLGFTRMFSDYGFSFFLEPQTAGATLVRIETYYKPRNIVARFMNVVTMKRKLGNTVEGILEGLKRFSEERKFARS